MGLFVDRHVRQDEVDGYVSAGWHEAGSSIYPNMTVVRIAVEAPVVEAPVVEAPVVEAPVVEAPKEAAVLTADEVVSGPSAPPAVPVKGRK